MKTIKKFSCLKQKKYELENYSLIALREADIDNIRKWRNMQMDVLRQKKKISKKKQRNYFKKVIEKNFTKKKPDLILFSYFIEEKCIGYGGLTNIDWDSKKAELSFLIDNDRYSVSKFYYQDFSYFLKLITKISFQELKFNKLFTETYNIRPLHIKILKKIGFRLEGKLKQHVNIQGTYVDSLIHGYLREEYIKK